jgi:hypothetical protein
MGNHLAIIPSSHRWRVRRATLFRVRASALTRASRSLMLGVPIDSGYRQGRARSLMPDPSGRGARKFSQNPPCMVLERRPILRIATVIPRRSFRRDNPPRGWYHVAPPFGSGRRPYTSRRAASALHWRRIPSIRSQFLLHLFPAADPPVLFSATKNHMHTPASLSREYMRVFNLGKHTSDGPSGRSLRR